MFGIFTTRKEMTAEIDGLRQDITSAVEDVCSGKVSEMGSRIGEKLLRLEEGLLSLDEKFLKLGEQFQQSLRQERRRQTALESILENQDRTIDTLERMEMSPPLEALMGLAENFALTRLANPGMPDADILYGKLTALMDCFGLTLTAESGVPFDPERHEACGARSEPGKEDGSVLEVVRPGFLLRDRVLRCATVVVNRSGAAGDIGETEACRC